MPDSSHDKIAAAAQAPAADPGAPAPPPRDVDGFVVSPSLVSGMVLFVDAIAIMASAAVSFAIFCQFTEYSFGYYTFAAIFVCFVTLALFNRAELYAPDAIMRPVGRSDAFIIGLLTAFLFFLTVAFSLKVSEVYSRLWMYGFAGGSLVTIVTLRLAVYRLLHTLSRQRLIGRALVVLGSGEQARQFVERMDRVKPYFTEMRGVYTLAPGDDGPTIGAYPVKGAMNDLVQAARRGDIDDVVVAMPWNANRVMTEAVETLKELPINVYISSDLAGFHLQFRPAFGTFENLPMFEVVQRPISGWSQLLKLIEDYVITSALLVLASPLLLATAIAIKLDSKGPVFFKQKRLGFNNQVFAIYKFRSMYVHEPPEGRTEQAKRDDPRITRVGRFIRRTSIDELPQLLNVLNGTMSLVGPRPHALDHNESFAHSVRGYFARHKVKPGITGWAQVNGFRGETDSLDKIKGRVERDVFYAENWSLLFDLRILVMTALVVLFQKNAH